MLHSKYIFIVIAIIALCFASTAYIIYFLNISNNYYSQHQFLTKPIPVTSVIPATLFKWNVVAQESTSSPQNNNQVEPLDLSLKGVVYSSNNRLSLAIIQGPNEQHSYREGEKLTDIEDAYVSVITPESVQIRHNDAIQTFVMEIRRESTSSKPAPTAPSVIQVKRLSDYLAVTPVYEKSTFIGYRVNPKTQTKIYKSMGLINNELVVKINGQPLENPKSSEVLMATLQSLRDVQFTVIRAGQAQNIYINLATLETSLDVNNHD